MLRCQKTGLPAKLKILKRFLKESARGQQTTKQAYRDALRRAGLCDEKGDIKTSEWIERLKAEETPAVIERNLDLEPGSFRKKKKKEKERN